MWPPGTYPDNRSEDRGHGAYGDPPNYGCQGVDGIDDVIIIDGVVRILWSNYSFVPSPLSSGSGDGFFTSPPPRIPIFAENHQIPVTKSNQKRYILVR
jgi:hypothetical protein